MQVLGINTSPRKKSETGKLLATLLQGAADSGCETRQLELREYDIRMCTGCETCYRTGSCVLDDQFTEVYDQMLAADAIILASPNYIDNVTARLKALYDRMGDTIHCQRFSGKYAAAVCTAGGSQAEDVAGYIARILQKMGADILGTAAYNGADGEEAIKKAYQHAYQVGIEIGDAIVTRPVYPDQQAVHEEIMARMRQLVQFRRDDWPATYAYWAEKKWL